MKNNKDTNRRNVMESLRGYGSFYYLWTKQRWAGWLEAKTARLSRLHLKVILLLCLFSCGGYCLFLVARGLSGMDGATLHFTPITPIATAYKDTEQKASVVTEQEYLKIKDFAAYMDSISRMDKQFYDSLTTLRPGLMDSIKMIETYYKSNSNKGKYGK